MNHSESSASMHPEAATPDGSFKGAAELREMIADRPEEEIGFDYSSLLERLTVQDFSERHPDWPKLKLNIHFSFHGTAEDFADLPNQLAGADIYLLEDARYSEQKKNFMQRVSDDGVGFPDVDELFARNPGFVGKSEETIIRTIFKSGIAVGSADMRGDDPYESAVTDDALAAYNRKLDETGSFEQLLESLEEKQKAIAEAQLVLLTRNG